MYSINMPGKTNQTNIKGNSLLSPTVQDLQLFLQILKAVTGLSSQKPCSAHDGQLISSSSHPLPGTREQDCYIKITVPDNEIRVIFQ